MTRRFELRRRQQIPHPLCFGRLVAVINQLRERPPPRPQRQRSGLVPIRSRPGPSKLTQRLKRLNVGVTAGAGAAEVAGFGEEVAAS